ncbi:ImmA/IrrE family metallo-endopeptidase [Carboxydothermus islandicus]|uniref:ImmA/IrrE family metallo-endopeptidase n=1 Tax=Carboxydothermus islandicus TaxID=661089 RepID=A0A1L8D0P7_9THEO|nr:ImmA/IrrE family metallo-endopeptidase [Carboxydothermus islandicus]GAV24766.1 ImmA/IrrE family metallo-endopeptidase [Carboxydothermus islandicus]
MDYVKQTVKQLVEEYETNDPYILAQSLGIDVDEFPFRRIKGLIIEIAGKVTIVLNSNLPAWFKRLVLAHELGHRKLSPQGVGYFFLADYTLMESKIEYDANRFAVELLTWGEEPDLDETMEHFAARIGLPKEMLRYKIAK